MTPANRRHFLTLTGLGIAAVALPRTASARGFAVVRSEADWRRRLTATQFYILREAGTEAPYTSPLNTEKRAGIFLCAGCNQSLFLSATKFDSGTGWPSFYAARKGAVLEKPDTSLGMERVEVLCSRCGGHLGHVFDDGPRPTGKRYCMNGAAMVFRAV